MTSMRIKCAVASVVLGGALAQSASAANYYWDGNDNSGAGFGSASGTWAAPTLGTATSGWSTSSTGAGATPINGNSVTTTTSDPLFFGTDTASFGLGGGTITVSGTVNAASLRFGSQTTSNVTLSGGTINLAATTTIHVGAGSTTVHNISSSITGAGTSLTKTGNTLQLSGANSYTGSTIISSGTLVLNNATALGGNNPGVNGTSLVTMANGTTLRSVFAGTTTVYAPIGITTAATIQNNGPASGTTTRNFTLNGAITGTGNVTFDANGGTNAYALTILNAASNYTGNTLITAATTGNQMSFVRLGVDNALPITTQLTLAGIDGTPNRYTILDLRGFNQEIAGLTGTGTTNRALRIINGTSATPTGTLTINTPSATSFTFSGNVGVAGTPGTLLGSNFSFEKKGAGTQTLTGAANAYTGLTTVSGGALRIGDNQSLGTTAGSTVVNGTTTSNAANARLELSGGITVTGEALTINGSGNFVGALTSFSGINEWAGNVTIGSASTRIGASAGSTLEVSGAIDSGIVNTGLSIRTTDLTGVVVLSGPNTYLGTTSLLVGKLQLDGGNDRLPVATNLVLSANGSSSAEFDLNGRNQEVAGLSLGGTATDLQNSVNNSSGTLSTLSVNTAAASPSTYAGILKGNLALTKSGAGSLTLTGGNSYTGATTVSDGTLLINGDNSAATGAVNVNGTSIVGGTGTIGGAVTVASTATIAPGASIESLDAPSAIINGTLLSEYDATSAGTSDLLAVTGLLTLGASSVLDLNPLGGPADDPAYIIATYGTLSGTFGSFVDMPSGYTVDYNYGGTNNTIAIVPIPEPTTLGLLAAAGLFLGRRKRVTA